MSHVRLAPHDPSYPLGLLDLPTPPSLWALGQVHPGQAAIAIVGTRRASSEALRFSYQLAAEFAAAGICVVSGGALGIDRAAHEGALSVRGQTLVVLPTPVDRLYPASHASLFGQILDSGGGLVSEQAPGTLLQTYHFVNRNRIIAALAQVTVVAEAPAGSGALATAKWAQKLGRPVFSVPSAPWDSGNEGGLRLLETGARVCTSARSVLSVAPFSRNSARAAHSQPQLELSTHHGDPDVRQVAQCLRRSAACVEGLVVALGWPVGRVLVALGTGQADGLFVEDEDSRYRVV